jgi:hypothetical protein
MNKLKHLFLAAVIGLILSLSFDTFVLSSFWIAPNPQYSFVISAATTSDIFLFGMPDEDIVFTEVEGILQSGTSVTGTIQKCNSAGLDCSTVISGLTFNGGRDTYTAFSSTTATANETLKWITNSVSSPGYLVVTLRYYPTGS